MINQIQQKEEDKKKRKVFFLIGMAAFVAAVLLVTGILIAYFSDTIFKTGTITSGTLDIEGNYAFYVNDSTTPTDTISNLNPGDVVVVKTTVTNRGNKSAWVREVLTFTDVDEGILPYLEVYYGEYTQDELLGGEADTDDLIDIGGGTAVTANRVLNGSGDNAETESGGGYVYINDYAYVAAFSIYFSETAGNSAQGQTIQFTVRTQALQFRNNDADEPNDAAWATVTATPYPVIET